MSGANQVSQGEMAYAIKTEGDTESLAKAVNTAIAEGWEVQGGVCSYQVVERDGYGNTFSYLWFAQAMVRRQRL